MSHQASSFIFAYMNYRNIIFDIDGTLLDTEYAILHSLQDTLYELLDKHFEQNELAFVLGIPGEVSLGKLGIEDTAEANRIWNRNFLRYKSDVQLFNGIPELLEELRRRGYGLGIITSKNPDEFHNDFEPYGITDYFETVVCVTDAPRPKPFADPILAYLKKTGLKKEEVIYIGDTAYDFECSRNANVDFALAAWGNVAPNDFAPKYVFHSVDEILSSFPAH